MIKYRKMGNGQEFMKIINNERAVSVFNTKYGSRIQASVNPVILEQYNDEAFSTDSNEDEFNAAFKAAIDNIDAKMK